MPYNNANLGRISRSLIESPFYQHYENGRPSPPPGEYNLIDDNGDFLLDDSGDYLTTPGI